MFSLSGVSTAERSLRRRALTGLVERGLLAVCLPLSVHVVLLCSHRACGALRSSGESPVERLCFVRLGLAIAWLCFQRRPT